MRTVVLCKTHMKEDCMHMDINIHCAYAVCEGTKLKDRNECTHTNTNIRKVATSSFSESQILIERNTVTTKGSDHKRGQHHHHSNLQFTSLAKNLLVQTSLIQTAQWLISLCLFTDVGGKFNSFKPKILCEWIQNVLWGNLADGYCLQEKLGKNFTRQWKQRRQGRNRC